MRPTPPVQPRHVRPAALAQVLTGGVLGAAAREVCLQALPPGSAAFPTIVVVVNLCGAFALGVLLEALVRLGDDDGWRRRARLVVGTGFLGAFTTYSTFAVETDLLVRDGHTVTAVAYVAATLLAGLIATSAGIFLGALGARGDIRELPVDPDVEAGT